MTEPHWWCIFKVWLGSDQYKLRYRSSNIEMDWWSAGRPAGRPVRPDRRPAERGSHFGGGGFEYA